MRKSEDCTAWVVYRRTIFRQAVGGVAVCEQSEWDEMELARPGHQTMIQRGITSEVEGRESCPEPAGRHTCPTSQSQVQGVMVRGARGWALRQHFSRERSADREGEPVEVSGNRFGWERFLFGLNRLRCVGPTYASG